MQRPRALGSRIVAHLVERPAEVHRRGTRGGQDVVRRVEVLAATRGERETVRGSDADRRRTADGERPDRLCDLGCGPAPQVDLLVRQPTLVEDYHRVALEADDALGRQVAGGHRLSLRRRYASLTRGQKLLAARRGA